MIAVKLLDNLDIYDKKILKALAVKSPQNMKRLSKNAGVSRKAITDRIKGKYELKRRKNLEQIDLIKIRKGKKTKFGKKEINLSITFKGLFLAYLLNDNNSEIKVKISQFKSEVDIKDNNAVFAAVKLWLNYYTEMLPGKFYDVSSKEFHREFIITIWRGVRYASIKPYYRSKGYGDPGHPSFYISFPYNTYIPHPT